MKSKNKIRYHATAAEVSQILGGQPCSDHIRMLARNGKLPCIKTAANQYLFDPEEVEYWLANKFHLFDDATRKELMAEMESSAENCIKPVDVEITEQSVDDEIDWGD